ncbi:MAG: hypothetical protein NWS20_00040, partial [Rickettsiaceae bacterium]|nr:hypothetical protein [Rickettsiaceae bacterium]MDP4832786.1 hypothetical protein [Rickettsiaceae bacterium]MDP5021053.1 hypothetical protein [Rickettsiaceae bacterium]
MEKKSSLKKFLATASAFAVISGAATSASAAGAVASVNDPSSFNTAADWNVARVLVDQDHITSAGNHAITADLGLYIEDIITAGNGLPAVNIAAAGVKLGNITTTGGANGAIVLTEGNSVTLVGGDRAARNTGADYGAIDGVDFGVAGGGGARSVTIDTRVALDHHVDGAAAAGLADAINLAGAVVNGNTGTLNVHTDLNVADESWGTIKTINIGEAANAATFKIESAGGDINLNTNPVNTVNFSHNNATLHLKNTGGANNVLISNGHIGGDADLQGKLIIESNGNAMNVAIANNATIGVDETHRLKELSFTGDRASTVAAKVYAQTINYGVTVAAKALTFNAEVKGGVGSLLKFTKANATEVVFNEHAQITDIDFNNFDKTIKVNAKTLTANIKGNVAGANRKGTLILQGANAEFAGVATNLVMIKAADGANTVKIGAGDHTVNEVQTLAVGGTIEFANGANIKATADANSGSIERTGGAAGKLKFLGSSVIEGSVGTVGPVAEITLTGGKDSKVTFKGNTSATELNIGKGTAVLDSTVGARVLTTEVKFTQADAEDSAGTLLIKGPNNATITSDIAKANLDKGIVRIDADVAGNVVEFQGQIGDKADANALNLLEIGANTTARFTTNGNVHINTVKLLGDGIVELSKAAGNFKIGKFENISNNGTLKISNNANLIGRAAVGDDAINFGTSTSRLKEFVINGDRDIEIGDGINIYANKFNNGAVNVGKLVFKGTSIFDMAALNTANDKLNTVTLDANANVTIASPDTAVNGLTTLGNDSTLVLQGNYI